MSIEKEIEFKNLLTKDEYLKLLEAFQFKADEALHQVNVYFSTEHLPLSEKKRAFRMRIKNNKYELTLKEADNELVSYETTVDINVQEAANILQTQEVDLQQYEPFKNLGNKLHILGSLETWRIETEFKGGLLVFDHSKYGQVEDYEVEYETTSEIEGARIFNLFLQQHQIPTRFANKKIVRFYEELLKAETRTGE